MGYMERRLNVSIPEATFRRLKAWAGMQGQEMTTATASVLEAGLNALGAPSAIPLSPPPDAGAKSGIRYPDAGSSPTAAASRCCEGE